MTSQNQPVLGGEGPPYEAERKAQKVFDGGGGLFVDGLYSIRGQRPLS